MKRIYFGKTLAFASLLALCGILFGLAFSTIMLTKATTNPVNNIIPISLYKDMFLPGMTHSGLHFDNMAFFVARHPAIVFLPLVLLAVAFYAFIRYDSFLRFENRDILNAFSKNPAHAMAASLVGLLTFIAFFASLSYYIVQNFSLELYTTAPHSDLRIGIVPVLVFGVLYFLIVAEGGWLSTIAGSKPGFAWAAARAIVPGVAAVGIVLISDEASHYLFKTLYIMGGAAEPTNPGLMRVILGVVIACALPFAAAGAAMRPMSPRGMVAASRVSSLLVFAVISIITAVVSTSFERHCKIAWEMDKKSLAEAASLSVMPEVMVRRALTLDGQKNVEAETLSLRAEAGIWGQPYVLDLTRENMAAIDRYLEFLKDRVTYFTFEAMEARRNIAARNWLIDEFRDICMKNSTGKGALINSTLLLESLDHAPANEANRKLLETLSDEREFHHGGKSLLRLARAWRSMGDAAQAARFYERARAELPPDELKVEGGFTGTVFAGGRVAGRVEGLTGVGDKAAVVVGLYYLDKELTDVKDMRLAGIFSAVRIKAAVKIAKDGSFAFDRVASGKYRLVALLPPGPVGHIGQSGKFDIQGGGPITIDAAHPTADMGVIRIDFSASKS
jgi:hypothetical protein